MADNKINSGSAASHEVDDQEVLDEGAEGTEHTEGPDETEETLAREKGWVPKGEFKGEANEWIDAKEFNARGPLYDAIHQANRKIKKLTETVESFKEHYSKVEQTAKQKAILELKKELKAASEDRDIERALEVKDKITELTQEVHSENTAGSEAVTPEFNVWIKSNEWYNTDRTLRHAANGIGVDLQQEHPDWSPNKIYKEVERRIKEEFPNKFKDEEDQHMTTVTTSNKRTPVARTSKKGVPAYKQLPDDAKVNYRRLVKSDRNPNGPLTHEQFMKDYVANSGPLQTEE